MKIDDPVKFEQLSWLLKAISKDKKRPHLMTVYFDSEKKQLAATDGHRLHVLKNIDWPCFQDLKSGSIEFAKSGKSFLFTEVCYGEFPNYERIIPVDCIEGMRIIPVNKNCLSEISGNFFKILKGLNNPLNFKYFKDATAIDDIEFVVSFSKIDGGAMKMESESLLAVLMPMRQ